MPTPTIIGGASPEQGTSLAPTRLGSQSLGGAEPSVISPSVVTRPTALAPTAIEASASSPVEAPVERHYGATALPDVKPAVAVPAGPVTASALPGTQRKPLAVEYAELAQRFPGTAPHILERAQAVLAGVSPQSMDSVAWLSFGVQAQEELAALVKQRLALMESPGLRSIAQHLSRLHLLLNEVLDALEGGFLRKPASKVWDAVAGEVHQIEDLLSKASPALLEVLGTMADLAKKNKDVSDDLQATSLAAEYLASRPEAQVGHLLAPRMTALCTSQALVLEQLQTLTLDTEHVQDLLTLVQDGVLLKLPAVYSQLAGLSAKPSDTQRFLAVETLTELLQSVKRNA